MSGIQIIGYYTVKNNVIFLIDLNVQKHFFHKIKCKRKKSDWRMTFCSPIIQTPDVWLVV
jgi:hypothetical protein